MTGSTRGIGRAIAERFAQRGARVVISSRDADACAAVAQEIADAGGEAIAVAAHVGKKEQLQNWSSARPPNGAGSTCWSATRR